VFGDIAEVKILKFPTVLYAVAKNN